jgi:hypothetical protein
MVFRGKLLPFVADTPPALPLIPSRLARPDNFKLVPVLLNPYWRSPVGYASSTLEGMAPQDDMRHCIHNAQS